MPARFKSSPKDSSANLGFEAKLWLEMLRDIYEVQITNPEISIDAMRMPHRETPNCVAVTSPEEPTVEFWFARDLQEPLGYARWVNFQTTIQRAIESCKTTGFEPAHHFRGVTKMVALGSWESVFNLGFNYGEFAAISSYPRP